MVSWLRSPEGENWSRDHHSGQDAGGDAARHSHGIFASIKDDHECHQTCEPAAQYMWLDKQIKDDIERYGMNGLPDAA